MSQREKIAVNQKEAARILGVSDQTIRNWERRKLIEGNRAAGGVKLYSVEKLKALCGK